MIHPAHYGWQYGYHNDRECFPVSGPGIDDEAQGRLLRFASPELAAEMCRVLQLAYWAGVAAAKEEIRTALGAKAVSA